MQQLNNDSINVTLICKYKIVNIIIFHSSRGGRWLALWRGQSTPAIGGPAESGPMRDTGHERTKGVEQ